MSPAKEVDGDITRNFRLLESRPCDEIWAVIGGSGYHGSIRGGVGGCAFASLLGMEYSNIPSKMTMIRHRKNPFLIPSSQPKYPYCSISTPH